MKRTVSILLISIVSACGSPDSIQITEAGDDHLYMFNDFPDSLFLGLYFDQSIDDSRKNLEQNKFELIDSSGAWRYWNSEDSNEVILAATEHLHWFKLMMKSAESLKSTELMHTIFKQHAVSAQCSSDFSVYTYNQKTCSFKLSVFEQNDLIRLNFEEQMRR